MTESLTHNESYCTTTCETSSTGSRVIIKLRVIKEVSVRGRNHCYNPRTIYVPSWNFPVSPVGTNWPRWIRKRQPRSKYIRWRKLNDKKITKWVQMFTWSALEYDQIETTVEEPYSQAWIAETKQNNLLSIICICIHITRQKEFIQLFKNSQPDDIFRRLCHPFRCTIFVRISYERTANSRIIITP